MTQLFAENIDLIARTTEETSAAATGIATAVEEQGAATHEITRNITEASTSVAGVAESVQAVAERPTPPPPLPAKFWRPRAS